MPVYWLMFCQFACTCGRCCCHIFLWQMVLPLMYLIVADVIAIIHCWLMLLPFLCVAMIVWQMLLPLWLMVLPFDVMYMVDVICQGGSWNTLPRWVWFMVRCYNHKWHMERPQGHLFYFSFSSGLLHRTSSLCGADGICLCCCSGTFAERFKEHLNAPSPIHDHSNRSGHDVTIDNFSIVGREDQNLIRTIKEALYIRVNNPSLNKNIGKYHLPHIGMRFCATVQN